LKKCIRYGFYLCCLLSLCSSCKKRLDKRVSLWRLDKIPYGTRYAYENLSSLFPRAEIRTGNRFPVIYSSETRQDTMRTLIVLSPLFAPEPDVMRSIIRFAASGNQIFISSLEIDDTVMSMLHMKQKGEMFSYRDSGEFSIRDPASKEWVKFVYPGYSYDNYFDAVDTGYTEVLGKNSRGLPDFIRIGYDHGGAIFIHLDPFAFSNFFLLHKKNSKYYDLALSYMPRQTDVVEWSDYFRYRRRPERFSALRFILSKRSLRWAFWLTILLFLFLFVFESKRKQRPVAEIPPLRNASEDFVKTVGRLYFQQKNNQNLAEKMVAAFLENIRSNYNLSTSQLNDEFAHKLAFRTGKPVSEIMATIHLIYEMRLKQDLSDQELMDLHKQITQFNKPA
jgi:hypothetical protein